MSKSLFDPTIEGLSKSLDLRSLRQNIHASNVANANTPGFKAQKLEFESALLSALETAEEATLDREVAVEQIKELKGSLKENTANGPSMDGNTVNVDSENAAMAENEILYNAAAKMIQKKMGLLKYAISEGNRN